MDDLTFPVAAFALLGIERMLYSYIYHFPPKFKESVRKGRFGASNQAEPLYWKVAMKLGAYIKIIQVSVITIDLLLRCSLTNPLSSWKNELFFLIGLTLVCFGQFLNYSVFKALGSIGVYYGYELGYPVDTVTCFPYNTKISDPQYWGVVIFIWGLYIGTGASSFLIPVIETLWYLSSMKVLENPRGKVLVNYFMKKTV
jgi:protein-S-isoprenylcysteine O-methyltransferase Ste14